MRRFVVGSWRAAVMAILAGPLLFSATLAAKEPKMKDLTDTVLSNHITQKFAILLRYSGLSSLLSSRGPLTLFVPTDSAFSRVPPEAFAALERPENMEVLQRIILFHVVNEQRLTEHDMAPLKTLLSCEGSPLPLRVNRAGYQIVSKAKILNADIHCLNGIMHEIDVVMLPPGVSLSALATAPPAAAVPSTNDSANPAAPTASGVPDAAGTTTPPGTTNSDSSTNTAPVAVPAQ